jgi:hypothetical protein
MSKTVAYTGSKWSGSVTFSDPLTIEQEATWEIARDQAAQFEKAFGKESAAYAMAIIPGVLRCVESWGLTGFPERIALDSIPAKPHAARSEFVAWLVKNVESLYEESQDLPNG